MFSIVRPHCTRRTTSTGESKKAAIDSERALSVYSRRRSKEKKGATSKRIIGGGALTQGGKKRGECHRLVEGGGKH